MSASQTLPDFLRRTHEVRGEEVFYRLSNRLSPFVAPDDLHETDFIATLDDRRTVRLKGRHTAHR